VEGREDFPWRSKSGLPLHSAVSPQEEEFFERVQAVLERVATTAVLPFRSLPLAACMIEPCSRKPPAQAGGIICPAYSVPLSQRDLLSVKPAGEFGKTAAVAAVRGVHVVPLRNDSEAIISGNALPHEDLLERPEVAGVDHE